MKLIPLPQAPQPAIVHNLKDYFSLPQLIDYANAVAEAKCAELAKLLHDNQVGSNKLGHELKAAEAQLAKVREDYAALLEKYNYERLK